LTEERALRVRFPAELARHLAVESVELPCLASDGFRYFKRCPSVVSPRADGREHEEQRDRDTEREREREREREEGKGRAQSPETFSIGVPLPFRPCRRRECRVSCNYSPMNFRLFRDPFRFSYREGPNSAKLSRGYPLTMSTRIRLPPQVCRGIGPDDISSTCRFLMH